MPGGLIRPELARAYQQYYGEKGGASPNVARDILSVVVVDDNSKGPYPASRTWQAGSILTSTAATYPRWGIQNADGFAPGSGLLGTSGVPRSVVVVDRVTMLRDATAGGDFFIGISHHNLFPLEDSFVGVDDTSPEKDPTAGATRPQLGNVQTGRRRINGVAILDTNSLIPGGTDGQQHIELGPWVLGPGQILYVERNLVNVGFFISARGRYYPAP